MPYNNNNDTYVAEYKRYGGHTPRRTYKNSFYPRLCARERYERILRPDEHIGGTMYVRARRPGAHLRLGSFSGPFVHEPENRTFRHAVRPLNASRSPGPPHKSRSDMNVV